MHQSNKEMGWLVTRRKSNRGCLSGGKVRHPVGNAMGNRRSDEYPTFMIVQLSFVYSHVPAWNYCVNLSCAFILDAAQLKGRCAISAGTGASVFRHRSTQPKKSEKEAICQAALLIFLYPRRGAGQCQTSHTPYPMHASCLTHANIPH